MTDRSAYGIEGLRDEDGSGFTAEVIGEQLEADARKLAQPYADLWQGKVNLYRVPFVHIGSAPWSKADLHLICIIAPRTETSA